MNFAELAKMEPGLKSLADEIIKFRDSKNYKKQDVVGTWYKNYKPKMLLLVGYSARNPKMQRADYYDTAYLYLFYLLDKENPLKMLPANEFKDEGYKHNFVTPGASQKNNISRPEENTIFDKKLKPIKQKKQRAGRPVLDMRRVRKIEDRIINAIDRKQDLQPIIDEQLKSVSLMKERFDIEVATSEKMQGLTGLKKNDLELLHLADAIHGEGLYSHQVAQKKHLKAATIRQRMSRAKRKYKTKQMTG
jgi:hypothetical protein